MYAAVSTAQVPAVMSEGMGQFIDFGELLSRTAEAAKRTAIAEVTTRVLQSPTVQQALEEKAKRGVAETVASEIVKGYDKTMEFYQKHKTPILVGGLATAGLASVGLVYVIRSWGRKK